MRNLMLLAAAIAFMSLGACTKNIAEVDVADSMTFDCASSNARCERQALSACPGGYDVIAAVRDPKPHTMTVRCR